MHPSQGYSRPQALRQTAFICVLGIFLLGTVWVVLDSQRTSNFTRLLSKESELAASLLKENLSLSERSIKRLVSRWAISGKIRKEEFFSDAYSYLSDFSGLEALEWIDSDLIVRWIVTSTGEDITPYLNQPVAEDEGRGLLEARQGLLPTMKYPRENKRGERSFLIYFPIYVDGRFDGFIRAEYNLQDWIGGVLGDTGFSNDLSYIIKIDGETVQPADGTAMDQSIDGSTEKTIGILGYRMGVTAVPGEQFAAFNSDYTPEITLSVGTLLIVLISVALHYYQRSTYIALQTKAKSIFLANMSHELRTPLNSIIGFSEMISSQVFGKIGNDRYLEYVDDIRNSGHHLLQLVNDVLDLSKIEAGKQELSEGEVDLNELMAYSLKMVRGRKEAQSVSFHYEPPEQPLRIKGDERALRQVMLNILSNAAKFNVEGGQVSISLRPHRDQSIAIAVSDTGIGIAPNDISKVLEPFGQVRSDPFVAHEGTGLGLPLSRLLMALHEGRLTIDSEIGKGTTVTVILPPKRRLNTRAGS